ncbi:meiosis-specific transcription factor ndt80 [Terramyces sp. JEL0728]|nr:meiosis-specific transcription factor ndt80 [Terramyces sp. JEL0728]
MPKKSTEKKSKAAGLKINTAIDNNANRAQRKEKLSPKKRVKESHIDPSQGTPDFGPTLTVELQTLLDKFFTLNDTWYCYRRNYFSLSCKLYIKDDKNIYTPKPYFLYDRQTNQAHEILRFEVTAEARVLDGNKTIEILQHTPKRDKAQKAAPMVLSPNTMLPEENGAPKLERLQFKCATQNTRTSKKPQQFFRFVVILKCVIREEVLYEPTKHGPIRDSDGNLVLDGNGVPLVPAFIEMESTVAVATKESVPFIVRGRSPGHYDAQGKEYKTIVSIEAEDGNYEETQEIPDSNTDCQESVAENLDSTEYPPDSNELLRESFTGPNLVNPKRMVPPTTPNSANVHSNFDTAYGGSCLWSEPKNSFSTQGANFQQYTELPLSYNRKIPYHPTNARGPLSAPIKKVEFFGANQPYQRQDANANDMAAIPRSNTPIFTGTPLIRSSSPGNNFQTGTPIPTPAQPSGLSQSFNGFGYTPPQMLDSQGTTPFDPYSQDSVQFEQLSKDVVDALSVDIKFNYPNLDDPQ